MDTKHKRLARQHRHHARHEAGRRGWHAVAFGYRCNAKQSAADAERAARALERERLRREREATRQRAYDEKDRKRSRLISRVNLLGGSSA